MRNILILALLSFGLAAAAPAFAAQAADPNCESGLAGVKNLTVTGLRVLDVAGDGWMGWQVMPDGRVLLAAVSKGSDLSVFEPVAGPDPIYVGHPASGQLTRAAWLSSEELVSGDSGGNFLRFRLGEKPAGAVESFGSEVSVLPEANVVSTLEGTAGDLALGLGQLSRVRIMPVGSVGPARDLQAQAPVRDVLLHRTLSGRRLAAVVTTVGVEVFDLDSPSVTPVFTGNLNSGAKPQWIVDDLGKSALMYQQNGSLTIVYPLGDHVTVEYPVPAEAAVQAMTAVSGEVMILVSRPDQSAEILSYAHDSFQRRGFVDGRSPMQAFLESPNGAIYVAYIKKKKDGTTGLQISRLSDLNKPIYSMRFEEEEIVRGFTVLSLDPHRHLLAVGSSKRIHILELIQH